jgi:hypothetical protein
MGRTKDEEKPNGGAAHLTREQRQQIRVGCLATGGNVTYTQMGARCAAVIGRAVNRDTIRAYCAPPS